MMVFLAPFDVSIVLITLMESVKTVKQQTINISGNHHILSIWCLSITSARINERHKWRQFSLNRNSNSATLKLSCFFCCCTLKRNSHWTILHFIKVFFVFVLCAFFCIVCYCCHCFFLKHTNYKKNPLYSRSIELFRSAVIVRECVIFCEIGGIDSFPRICVNHLFAWYILLSLHWILIVTLNVRARERVFALPHWARKRNNVKVFVLFKSFIVFFDRMALIKWAIYLRWTC